MNKLFAALLFFCVIGASVLWWLMKMLPDDTATPVKHSQPADTSHGVKKADDVHKAEVEKAEAELVLRVDTIPAGAKVEVGGVYAGVTPLDIPLAQDKKEALIALEGYDVYRREVPSIEAAEGAELNWKITLKAKASEVKVADVKTAVPKKELKNAWLHGSKGPYFIQFKAVSDSVGKNAFQDEVAEFRSVLDSEKISGCLVNLGQRGKWFRILAGPFKTRAEANSKRVEWMSRKPDVTESFVTGRQSCI